MANIVCVGWHWVANIVCVAWVAVTIAFCVAWEALVTVVGAVLVTLESIGSWILSAAAWLLDVVFMIPILGRLLNWLWNLILTGVSFVVGAADIALGAAGIRPEKKLRVRVVVLRDETGVPVVEDFAPIIAALQRAADIYMEQANVRLIASAPFQYNSAFGKKETATGDWISVYPAQGGSPTYVLDAECHTAVAGTDLTLAGSWYEAAMSRIDFYGNWRRLTGIGAPVTVFVVRRHISVPPSTGCSLGPLTNYVTVQLPELTIGHELGHACNLRHSEDRNNLMIPDGTGTQLDLSRILLVRSSRHVTYF